MEAFIFDEKEFRISKTVSKFSHNALGIFHELSYIYIFFLLPEFILEKISKFLDLQHCEHCLR